MVIQYIGNDTSIYTLSTGKEFVLTGKELEELTEVIVQDKIEEHQEELNVELMQIILNIEAYLADQ